MNTFDCFPILRGTAAAGTGTLTITLPNSTYALRNCDILKFVIANTIPSSVAASTPVSISVNGTTFALKDRVSNNIVAGQLRSRWVYVIKLGAETPSFTMLTCTPDSGVTYPVYAPPTT